MLYVGLLDEKPLEAAVPKPCRGSRSDRWSCRSAAIGVEERLRRPCHIELAASQLYVLPVIGDSCLNVYLDPLLVGPVPTTCRPEKMLTLGHSGAGGAEQSLKHGFLVSLHGGCGVTRQHNQLLNHDLCQGIPELQQVGCSAEGQEEVDEASDVSVKQRKTLRQCLGTVMNIAT